ncbi:MAG: patatin-like phospholipase family protein [Candidatus Electryonea clarkiae]|nr:patatin-like phospholipase family protein [Candidatus Electryonea clarkiae]
MLKELRQKIFGKEKKKLLTLTGGGARGLAHIGVIEVLQEEGWIPDLVCGTSMGAVVGAVYSLFGDADILRPKLQEAMESEYLRQFKFSRVAPIAGNGKSPIGDSRTNLLQLINFTRFEAGQGDFASANLMRILKLLLGDATFDDINIPFISIATDLYSGKTVDLKKGKLADAVLASSSIPGVFKPVEWDDMLLVDGCVIGNTIVPDQNTRNDYKILAVDVNPLPRCSEYLKSNLNVFLRADQISNYYLNQFNLNVADIVIKPELNQVHWTDFKNVDELIKAGRIAAEKYFKDRSFESNYLERLSAKIQFCEEYGLENYEYHNNK